MLWFVLINSVTVILNLFMYLDLKGKTVPVFTVLYPK